MGTPAEVLQQFWQELRGRTRVTIDHPDLPDALKDIAAEAIKTAWQAANEAASSELAALRVEARDVANAAEAERDDARARRASGPPRSCAANWPPRAARPATPPWPHAEARARLEAQAATLTDRLAAAEQAQGRHALELERVGVELAAAQRRAERAEAEGPLARQLLAELRGALHELDGGGRRRGATPKESRHGRSP